MHRDQRRDEYQRQWIGAKSSRLFADWTIPADDINDELERAIAPVRGRARELEQNNDLARRYLQLVETHTVGPSGMTLQVRGELSNGKPDARGNDRIERAFRRWGEKGSCEVTGQLSWRDLERLIIRTVARDGEVLVRFWNIKGRNPESLQLEIIDPQRLDQHYKTGNVRLGVETDAAGRPVAYYLKSRIADKTGKEKLERVPADQILHIYRQDRPGQMRGMTWMSSAMVTMHMLEKYQESAMVAAREGANKMGFWSTPDGDPSRVAEQEADGDFVSETEAGIFGVAPAGWSFTAYDPTYPHELYEDFMRANLRTVAQALNVSYHGLTGDLTAVNYSSIRAGTLEDREYWMLVQDWFATNFQRPVYLRWLALALNTSLFDQLPRVSDRRAALQRYSEHAWQGRRWAWVDPAKDADASIRLIGARLKSPQRVAAEMGVDVADVLDEIALFEQMAREKGVAIGADAQEQPQEPSNDDTQD